MSVKYYCDCCEEEITAENHCGTAPLGILCHLAENLNLSQAKVKMVKGKMEPISGRVTSLELCLPCYNQVAGAAAKTYHELKITKHKN